MSLPDYKNRKQLVESYRWRLGGWPASSYNTGDTVMLFRWEDKDGNVINPPMAVKLPDGTAVYKKTELGEHEVFLHMPYHGTIAEWGELLFADMAKRVKA